VDLAPKVKGGEAGGELGSEPFQLNGGRLGIPGTIRLTHSDRTYRRYELIFDQGRHIVLPPLLVRQKIPAGSIIHQTPAQLFSHWIGGIAS